MIYALYAAVVLVLIGCDQLLKAWTVSNLALGESAAFLPGLLQLTRVHNYGAAWSSFSGKTVMLIAVTAVLLVPVLLLAPELTAFFNQKPEVVSYGALLLRLLSPFYFFFCINQVYSAALRGAGNSQVPMWIMLGSFVVFRQIYLFVVANYVANEIIPIALSYPAGWFLCSAATLIYYSRCRFDKHRLVEDV